MMPAAPLVGAVTTRPPAAFSSFTASAKRLTQSSTGERIALVRRRRRSMQLCDSSSGARRRTFRPPGRMPSCRQPRSTHACIASQMRARPASDLRLAAATRVSFAQHERADGQARGVGTGRAAPRRRRTGTATASRPPRCRIAPAAASSHHEPAADRVVHLARRARRPRAPSAAKRMPFGMARQRLASRNAGARVAERRLVRAPRRQGDPGARTRATRASTASGSTPSGVSPIEAEQHGLVRAVAPAGGAERAVEVDLTARLRRAARRVERAHEPARRLHRADGVRAGGPDADLEQIEDADSHTVTPSLHRCRRSPERPRAARRPAVAAAVPRLTAFLRAC